MKLKDMQFYKEILVHFRNYLTGSVAIQTLAFISLPVLTRLLSSAEYGTYSVFMTYTGLTTVLVTLNAHAAVGRYFYEDKGDFAEFMGTTVIITGVLVAANTAAFVLLNRFFSAWSKLPAPLVLLMPVLIGVTVLDNLFQQIYQPLRQSKKIVIIGMIRAYSAFAVGVCLVLLAPSDRYMGLIWAQVIIGMGVSVYLVFQIKPYVKPAFSFRHAKYIFVYAIPLIPYTLSTVILDQFDRIMIHNYLGASDTGLYSFAYNIGMVLSIVSATLYQAWMPSYFQHMNNHTYAAHDQTVDKMFRLIVLAAILLILFGEDLGALLGAKQFHRSVHIIPIIVMGYVFGAIFPIYAWNMGYTYKTFLGSGIVLFSGVVNILLNRVYIPRYGYEAAAYTTLVSYCIMAVLAWLANRMFITLHRTPILIILRPLAALLFIHAALFLLRQVARGFLIMTAGKLMILIIVSVLLTRPLLREPALKGGAA